MDGEKRDWKGMSEILFFQDHMKIGDICRKVGRTRKYVSGHLQGCSGYEAEKRWRKSRQEGGEVYGPEQEEKRRQYQMEWNRSHRRESFAAGGVTADTLRQEHDTAARILSSERY